MGTGYGYDGKYGPLSDDLRRKLREQQESLLGDAEAFWRTEKEKARSWVRGNPPLPKPRVRLKKTTP
jgi:hypothetical protein